MKYDIGDIILTKDVVYYIDHGDFHEYEHPDYNKRVAIIIDKEITKEVYVVIFSGIEKRICKIKEYLIDKKL